ncbi:MAG: magnesium chelatase, partial [Bacteroidetes bacterium]|nr:magnesium chelatase [Bacteroidota bacterium]
MTENLENTENPAGSENQNPMTNDSSFGLDRENQDLIWVAEKVNQVREELARFIIGQHETVELLIAGIFANGHVLLEGVPGVAKTLASKVLSRTLN